MKFKALITNNLVYINVITLKMYLHEATNKSPMHISQLEKLVTLYLMYICYNFLYRFLFKLTILIEW
jgi:hypothetical protein